MTKITENEIELLEGFYFKNPETSNFLMEAQNG